MPEQEVVYYGEVKLMPGSVCEGYVPDDGTAVMSERGTAALLDMDQKTLNAMRENWPPKPLKSFIDNEFTMRGNYVRVTAQNSPYCGRKIAVYTSGTIESLIRTYAASFINEGLRKNQLHIGRRAVALLIALVRTALDTAIKEACGFVPRIQETARKHYVDAVALLGEFGFVCSLLPLAGINPHR